MDLGIQHASKQAVVNALPISWIGRADMPPELPAYANIAKLESDQVRNLQAQIGYNLSLWDYALIGTNNLLGRYQFATTLLESYGLLAVGSNEYYGTDCVNYNTCWRQVTIRTNTSSYASYLYDSTNIHDFLTNSVAQEHLAYQVIFDLYNDLAQVNAIQDTDSTDTIAGMISVAWELGVGTEPTYDNAAGTGAYAWRYANIGAGAAAYNRGRYAITILSQ